MTNQMMEDMAGKMALSMMYMGGDITKEEYDKSLEASEELGFPTLAARDGKVWRATSAFNDIHEGMGKTPEEAVEELKILMEGA